MNSKSLSCSVCAFFVFALAAGALAQDPLPRHFSGLINDFSPSTVKGGPYEMHGTWSLELHRHRGTADFSAAMTMETSDYGIPEGIVNPAQPSTRSAHTHHLALTDATVTFDMTGCPAFKPATTMGFQVNGTVSLITGNGGPAPFETDPPSSKLQVCITGGPDVARSNITLVFTGPATSHFGPQAINGVVQKSKTDQE